MEAGSDFVNVGFASSAGILFCSLCNKPFSHESALKRHVSYCRRTRSRPRVRPKPCRECKAAKSKCTLDNRCARCNKKGLQCVYPDAQAQGYDESIGTALVPISPTSARYMSQPAVDVLSFPNDEQPRWVSHHYQTPDITGLFLGDVPGFSTVNGPEPAALLADNISDVELVVRRSIDDMGVPGIIHNCSIIPNPGVQFSFPLAQFRPSNPIADNSASIIRQSLSSYPQMMLRRSTFPPFIHPRKDKSHLPEPLANCMGIAVLFVARNSDTRPFLWKAVREEQERCLREMKNWSKYEVFAAVQAELIYITMRVVDGCARSIQDREQNTSMLFAYEALWTQYMILENRMSCNMNTVDSATDWEDWVQEESRVRIACVWFLIAQISSVRIGRACSVLDAWTSLPLPSHKAQWAATTAEDWAEEVEATRLMNSRDKSPTTFGELLELTQRANEKSVSDRLHMWNAGVDNIGVLLNLATTMV